ncbi:MAG: SDR family oxidoreductase, partial [Bacillota bacterium]
MASILVTGVAGMLGSNIAYLLRHKHTICGVDRNHVGIEGTHTVKDSVLNIALLNRLMEEHKVDTLIHCAAIVNVDACEIHPDYAEIVNVIMTDNIAWLCREKHVRMIYISSDAVYSGEKEGLNLETDTPAPVSIYGRTKLAAEELVLSRPGNLVLRTNMYGFNYREKLSFGEWLLKSLAEEAELNMFYDILFSPLLVNHLVDVLDKCIEKDLTGLYNAGCTGAISKYDLGVAFSKTFALPNEIKRGSMKDFQFKAPRTRNMGLDNAKLKQALGVELQSPLEEVRAFRALYEQGYG